MDFGLAKLAGQPRLTKTGTTMGTIAYMSPEKIAGEEVDTRTDIWSLGIVVYEILFDCLPFDGGFEQSIMYAIMNEEPSYEGETKKRVNFCLNTTHKKMPSERCTCQISTPGKISF